MELSNDILYTIIGVIAAVIIFILVLIICLCKRRKRKNNRKDTSYEMGVKDSDTERLYARPKKKKNMDNKVTHETNASPPIDLSQGNTTAIDGVYARISSADFEEKYGVTSGYLQACDNQDGRLDTCLLDTGNTYVKMARSNSFNPRLKERPIIQKYKGCLEEDENVERYDSIHMIETGIAPAEISDIKSRLADVCLDDNLLRVKQKRTSHKGIKEGHRPLSAFSTHENVKIMMPIPKKICGVKKNVDELKRNDNLSNTDDIGKATSVVSSSGSTTSDVASNLECADSGYDDVNSEHYPLETKNSKDAHGSKCKPSVNESPLTQKNSLEPSNVEIEQESCVTVVSAVE